MSLEELNAVTQKAAIGEAKYFLARREGPEFLNALRVIHDLEHDILVLGIQHTIMQRRLGLLPQKPKET